MEGHSVVYQFEEVQHVKFSTISKAKAGSIILIHTYSRQNEKFSSENTLRQVETCISMSFGAMEISYTTV